MKTTIKLMHLLILLSPIVTLAQLPQTKIVNGNLRTVESGLNPVPPKGRYTKLTDSLDKNLKANLKDTTSLFYRALIYYTYNQMLAEPAQNTKGTLENLTLAKDLIERVISLGKSDLSTKILRAQIYWELTYRLSADESWMFSAAQLASRKKLFESYKSLNNRYYTELAALDKPNAYNYERKKIK